MTPKKILVVQHLLISFLVLGVLFGAFFLLLPFAENIFLNPDIFFAGAAWSPVQTQFSIVCLALLVAAVLFSYVVYLLLTQKTRAELLLWKRMGGILVSQEQFKVLYESAPVPYMMLNERGEVQNPNKAALRFFGVFPEEIEGKILFSFAPVEEKEHSDKLLRFYKSKLPINREEIQMATKNGAVRWALLSVFDMKNPAGGARIGLATIVDITEEKNLSKAKTEFVSLASHQLRSPLATLKWYTDMLLSNGIGELNAKQKEYTGRIFQVNEEMIGLVDTLLNVSRMEIGSFVVDKKATNVPELCESILVELSSQIATKKINVEKKYGDALKDVSTDPKLLRIVIQNLVSNAIKYTPDGGTVTIALEESRASKQITISDTGVGIPRAQQERVFSKLFRASNVASMGANRSTGLGLYLTKSIVEALGGHISFTSEENKGSAFTIVL